MSKTKKIVSGIAASAVLVALAYVAGEQLGGAFARAEIEAAREGEA